MCTICSYNMVKDIDRALLAGVTPAALSKQYRFTASELQRHQEHLHQKMTLTAGRFHVNLHQMLFCKLNIVMEMTLTVIRKTRHNEDPRLFLQAGREFTRIINLMHKMADRLPFDPEFIYCLMGSPQWEQQDDALLPHAFPALSETRQSLKQNFFARCPEPEPEPAPTPLPTSPPESQNSPPETLIDHRRPAPGKKVSALPPRPQFNAPKTAKMATVRRLILII